MSRKKKRIVTVIEFENWRVIITDKAYPPIVHDFIKAIGERINGK